jgi:thioredoxin 1
MPVAVSDATFEAEVLKAELPVLVDFWAEWCGPCRALAPIVAAIDEAYAGRLKVCKLDVDTNRELAEKHDIRGIPTLLFFKGGEVVDQHVGLLKQTELAAKCDALLAG